MNWVTIKFHELKTAKNLNFTILHLYISNIERSITGKVKSRFLKTLHHFKGLFTYFSNITLYYTQKLMK